MDGIEVDTLSPHFRHTSLSIPLNTGHRLSPAAISEHFSTLNFNLFTDTLS